MITNYSFNKETARKLVKSNTYATRSLNSNFTLEDFIPLSVINEDSAVDSSPLDLISITNATDLIAVDYQKNNNTIASILALKTNNGVYEHTKYICDRLLGAELLSVSTIQVRDYHFIKSIIKNIDGALEFVLSLSAREINNNQNFAIESHWNLDKYEGNGTYYNFQIWSNSPDNLLLLSNEVINLLEIQKDISSYTLSTPPPVFVKKGFYRNGVLELSVINTNASSNVLFDAGYKETETSNLFNTTSTLDLNENYLSNINVSTGNLFDIGFRIGDGIRTPDDLFMSDGPWGIDYNTTTTQILNYDVKLNDTFPSVDEYLIERNPNIKVQTTEGISIYKAFTPRFKPVNLSNYNTLEFNAKGVGEMEIRFIKDNINIWEYQYKTTINLNNQLIKHQIPLVDFKSNNEGNMILDNAVTIVFTLLATDGTEQIKEVSIEEIKLTNLDTLSLNNINANNFIAISHAINFPNPFKNSTTLQIPEKSNYIHLTIYDLLGRVVFNDAIKTNDDNNSIRIKLNDISPGLYKYNALTDAQKTYIGTLSVK